MTKFTASLVVVICVLLASCAAQPPTHYFDLTPLATTTDQKISGDVMLGIGPVTLPPLLDRPGIVSRHSETGVNIASYHVWAGELEPTFTRVLAESIATNLQLQTVWAFPWDNRFRPEYQVRLFVERFSGELEGDVQLSLSWTLLGAFGQQVISTQRYHATAKSEGGYQGYVDALNSLLAGFSKEVSEYLSEELPQ